MTGREQLRLVGRLHGLSGAALEAAIDDALARVDLRDAADRRAGGYSGGMRQRLGIAGALVHRPPVMVLDEPVSALDPEGRRDVLGLIASLRGETTVLFSSHVLGDVERICDRVAILDHGRLVVEGALGELLDRYAQPVWRIEAEPGDDAALSALAAQPPRAAVGDGGRRRARPAHGGGRRHGHRLTGAAARDHRVGRGGGVGRKGQAHARGRVLAAHRRDGGGCGMSGFAILLAKELRESWRTRRLPLVAILFILIGLISPLTAKYLPDILKAALGDQAAGIPMPVADATAALGQLQKNLGQLGALAAIALAMGAVSGELDRGTAALVLAQPVSRPSFIAAKLAGIGVVLAIATALGTAVAWIYTAILFEPLPIGGWVALAALDWLALFSWASLDVVGVGRHGSTTTAAAGLGFVALIAVSVAAVVPVLERILPAGLTAAQRCRSRPVLARRSTGRSSRRRSPGPRSCAGWRRSGRWSHSGDASCSGERRESRTAPCRAPSVAAREPGEMPGELSGANLALEAALEPLDLARGVDDVLLARVERVAVAAHVNAQLLPGGPDGELRAARSAVDRGLVILRVRVGFHRCSSGAVRTGPARR